MKRSKHIAAIALILAIAVFTSCSKNYNAPAAATNPAINASSIPGNWTVTSFTQRTEDKTSQFSGFVFTFSASGTNSGTIVASKGNDSVTGSWAFSPAVTYYGSTSTSSMILGLGVANPLNLLTKTWNVESTSDTKITLVSPELVEDEHLVFTKK